MENLINDLVDFLNKSHSEYNACNNIKNILLENNFIELNEGDNFEVERGKNYFLTRNDSSIVAFKIPAMLRRFDFTIMASHLDSPCLKIKMDNGVRSYGYHKLNVEVYGGLITSTWLDKPLSIAGRIFYKNNDKVETKIIDIDKPVLIIPNVCIHFNRNINNGFIYNPEVDLKPIMSLGEENNSIMKLLCSYTSLKEEDVISYDLNVYNYEKSMVGGINNEFLISPKIDNLESAYLSLRSFLDSGETENIKVYVSFDNEEIGSETYGGADGDFLKNTLKRISNSLGFSENNFYAALANSFLVSIDNGHAVHPNHPELSDPNNLVYLNKGPIIKFNSNMAYMSDAYTSSLVVDVCKKNNIPYQFFYNKSDVRGGSTLGALSTSQIGIKTCDIGCAQLSMHSSYETAGTKDVDYMYELIKDIYNQR